jgi:dipeptidyl aminopeptidase/acylaminoacyl peptidase
VCSSDLNGTFFSSLSFAQLPTGVLTVTLSNLTLIGDPVTWQAQWSPATIRTDLPANPTSQPRVCLTADSVAQLQSAPADLLNGKALTYESLDGSDKWGLVLYNLDGSGKQVLASDAGWGSLSPDGSRMAYPASDGIHVIDLATKAEKVLTGVVGFNLHWSPDGKQIAYVGDSDSIVDSVFIVNADGTGTQVRQISNLSYESVVGWSPDGTLYFVAPFTGGAAWKVYSYDLASGTAQERFTIENGTPKFLNPQLSQDGNWIAYRGRDNSSVYLVHPDGSDMHLIIDNAGAVGIEWSGSGWLGVSMGTTDPDVSTVALIKPDGCEAYLLPAALHGELEGLFIP